MTTIPIVPVKNIVVFPGTTAPLLIGRAQSIAAIQSAQKLEGWVLVVVQKHDTEDRMVNSEDLFSIGTLAKIERVRGDAAHGYQILVRGDKRFRIEKSDEREGHLWAMGIEMVDVVDLDTATYKSLLSSLKQLAQNILDLLPANTSRLAEVLSGIEDLSFLSHLCIANLEMNLLEKQSLLEETHLKKRVLRLLELMQMQYEGLKVQAEVRDKLSQKIGKQQREALLREQLRTIKDELGEKKNADVTEDYRQKFEKVGMPEETKKIAQNELERLEAMGPNSAETHIIRNYLDLLCSLPWSKSSGDEALENFNLKEARESLNRDHYGLEKIKNRILQHLAVMKLRKSSKGQILLLLGPPGVGKTSLGQSIAKALGRKFVRGSLGGVRDEAEIRGHRRTYIGAMPGRIILGLKRAGENNPVFMLDEIDKLVRGYGGDPSSALLEVLDPEQNNSFLDHYLDVPFDLSKVIFVATANSLDSIPAPLLDRMEIIDLHAYTTAEKFHIAKNHLLQKQFEEHNLSSTQLVMSDEALLKIINSYTREAGVRELQRKLSHICRAMAEEVLTKGVGEPVRVEVKDLVDILGSERFVHEVAERLSPPGVATGLAWTPQGGEILFIEANLMPGNGKLIVTGQLGEVMKESTQIALSLVRSKLSHLIRDFEFEKRDLHVHVPAGAIPKDGPSAGVTMLTSIASILTRTSVDPKLAMTGEITLRGAVMPVGGIKEKIIAAHTAGVERVILAKRNEVDLREVPEEVKSTIQFYFVENVFEVLKIALGLDLDLPQKFEPTLATSSISVQPLN